jgi:hypothetical protein
MIVVSENSNSGIIITPRHFWKNVLGLATFATLFAYCLYKLATSNEPTVLLLAGIGAFSLLLTCIRVMRRLFLIRRIIAAGGLWRE